MKSASAEAAILKDAPRRTADHFLLGDLPSLTKDRLGFLTKIPAQYGPLVKIRFGVTPFYLTTSPTDMQHILQTNYRNYRKEKGASTVLGKHHRNTLATSHGDEWLKRRRLMQPSFNRNRIDQFAPIMVEEAEELANRWESAAGGKEVVAVAQEMKDITMRVIGRSMFSIDRHKDFHDLYQAYITVGNFIVSRCFSAIKPPLFIPTPQNRAYKAADRIITRTLEMMIAERLREHIPRNDLLDGLLEARSEDDGSGLSHQQLIAEMSILVFAGHETTATTLTWILYILSQHPDVEERFHAELDEVLQGRAPTVADLPKLEYGFRVIMEAIRLYPAAYLTLREAIGDDVLGEYRLPAKSKLLLNIYGIHRDPQYWETPDRFNPDHFEESRVRERPKLAFLPFGAGPRKCIGEPLAMMEIQMVLAVLGQRYRMRLAPGHVVEPEAGFALQPRGGLPMTVERRTNHS